MKFGSKKVIFGATWGGGGWTWFVNQPYSGKIKKKRFFGTFPNSLYSVMMMQSLTKPASPQVGPFVYQALTIKDTVEEDGKSNLRYNEDGTTLTYRPRSPIE